MYETGSFSMGVPINRGQQFVENVRSFIILKGGNDNEKPS